MVDSGPAKTGEVRTAELIAALSLATDLGIGVPLEHGLQSTAIAMRLCDLLDLDEVTRFQSYYMCLLFYIGCTATDDLDPGVFGADNALTTYATPHRFGSTAESLRGVLRAVAPPSGSPGLRTWQLARGLPKLVRDMPGQVAAICEVARMLTDRLGLPESLSSLFAYEGARWDGKDWPNSARGEDIPTAVRIVNVARDAAFQLLTSTPDEVARLMIERAGKGLDPVMAGELAANADLLHFDPAESAWDLILGLEPEPWLYLDGAEVDRALAAMGAFSDLASPHLVGHSVGVAELARSAAAQLGLDDVAATRIRRAGLIHDLGRVAVPVRIWQQPTPMSADDREQVRLHAYHTERVLSRSAFLADLGSTAGLHHERLDGSGYHRGVHAPGMDAAARLLAAVDAFHAMTEPRAHRPALSAETAAAKLIGDARKGRLAPDAVSAVLEAAGQRHPRVLGPAGLTAREIEVVGRLARGRQAKQVARELGISIKTVDHHTQSAYRKMGVSTRAGATLFAMENGLLTWGELPIDRVESNP